LHECSRTIRKEFTAEDDDLVLRYIAAYDPEKKRMTSKSFYTEMVSQVCFGEPARYIERAYLVIIR
jgi:hypothetical protein